MIAVWLAIYLHAPQGLVATVYDFAGLDGVAVVFMESRFVETARRREPQGESWGLFQLYDKFHPQYRDDLLLHIVTGVAFLNECKDIAPPWYQDVPGFFARAVAHYNGGTHPGAYSWAWGRKVEAKRDELQRWLSWRAVKAMETAR